MDVTKYRKASFDQNAYLNGVTNPSTVGGACHLFAMKWISLISANKSDGAQSRMDALHRYKNEVIMLNKSFKDRWILEGENGSDATPAAFLGLTMTSQQTLDMRISVSATVLAQSRKGMIYTFRWPGIGAHSIGVYRSGYGITGHVYVFEPNLGEYKMDKWTFPMWVRNLQRSHYNLGTVGSHQLRYYRARDGYPVLGQHRPRVA